MTHQHRPPSDDTEASMRLLLQQTTPTPAGPELERVQHNALSAWHAHRAQHTVQQTGATATLGRTRAFWLRHAALGWLILATALCLAVGLRPTLDAALAELQQPDVLSQILMEDL